MVQLARVVVILFIGLCSASFAQQIQPESRGTYGPAQVAYNIVYATVDNGRELHLDLYQPEVANNNPVVLWIHGGGWSRGNKRTARQSLTQSLVSNGFTVAALEYRLSGEAVFPAQIHDVKRAVRFLRRNAKELKIDAERMAAWGISAGGHLSALLATTDHTDGLEPPLAAGEEPVSTRIQAAASWVGPMDLRPAAGANPQARAFSIVGSFLGKSYAEDPAVYALASPVTHVSPDDPPVFIVQGRQDALVHFSQALKLDAALTKAAVVHKLLMVEGMGHGRALLFGKPMAPSREEIRDAFVVFLKEHLRVAEAQLY